MPLVVMTSPKGLLSLGGRTQPRGIFVALRRLSALTPVREIQATQLVVPSPLVLVPAAAAALQSASAPLTIFSPAVMPLVAAAWTAAWVHWPEVTKMTLAGVKESVTFLLALMLESWHVVLKPAQSPPHPPNQ